MNRIFSGIQPTGNLHLGNYLGAIRNWVGLQDDFESIYCIVDLHAVTLPQDPDELRRNLREVTAGVVAAGVDPQRCILFAQSAVPAHSELAWLLACQTPLGWLNRMTQFKDKAGKNREQAFAGLFVYPVLQAADILIYRATHVPVGEDQKQHLELSRDIAGAFNRQYGADFFPLPEPLIFGEATRVMSLRDGRSKMSSSDASDQSRINLTDDADAIAKKIRRAKSDSIMGLSYDPENHQHMVELRAQKVMNAQLLIPPLAVDGPESGEVLVLSWGGTMGACREAAVQARAGGHAVAHAHLRHLHPMPANLGAVLARYRRVLVPELNMGQLAMLIRAHYSVQVEQFNKVQGRPFTVGELLREIRALTAEAAPA